MPDTIAPSVRFDIRDGGVAIITLDRPAARNAINRAIALAVEGYIDVCEADDAIRVMILASSHDRVFCAGADLAEIAEGKAALLSTDRGGFGGVVRRARTKPLIAAVDGFALAGGCEIVLACDMVVCSTNARFGLPEVKRGLFAGAGGPYRIQRALPRAIATELLCTGDPINAERAYALGMVNRLTAPGAALEEAVALARTIAGNGPMAVRETLSVARQSGAQTEEEFWHLSNATTDLVLASSDAREGARAFLEKRLPVWTGA
jgi:enoyl-CoA hydratase/carnithine racemase